MGLEMRVTTVHGIILDNAYIRIDEQSGNKQIVNLRVRKYASIEDCLEGRPWIEENVHNFVPSIDEGSDNFIKQGYEYLKELPEFNGAIDVLE